MGRGWEGRGRVSWAESKNVALLGGGEDKASERGVFGGGAVDELQAAHLASVPVNDKTHAMKAAHFGGSAIAVSTRGTTFDLCRMALPFLCYLILLFSWGALSHSCAPIDQIDRHVCIIIDGWH